MGWKGTIRSLSAAIRAAERDAQRRQKAAQRAQVIETSAAAVSEWETYIDDLVTVHTDLTDAIDWRSIAEQPKPIEPSAACTFQQNAATALATFKPGLFDIFRGGTAKRRACLEADLADAPARDQAEHEEALISFRAAFDEWHTDTVLARRLVDGDAAAIREVIEEMQRLSENSLIGSSVSFSIDDGFIHAMPEVHTDEIIPNFRRKQLASGKLSETKMPVGQFNELYQDYVGSVALKIASDLFRIIPIDELYVTCLSNMLNSQTGHQERMPILSIQFVRSTFANLNLANLDPSDSMANFNHAMSFRKTKGFAPIEPLRPTD